MDTLGRWLGRAVRWPVALAWMALIFALSSIPVEIVTVKPQCIPLDKVAHAGEYMVLAFLVTGVGWRRAPRLRPLVVAGSIVLALLYGAGDEFHQRFVPGRDAALNDLAADAVGATVGALTAAGCLLLSERLPPRGLRRGGSVSARRGP